MVTFKDNFYFCQNVALFGVVVYWAHMTTIDTLGKIIGSAARVKLMRLFLFHPGHGFTRDELIKKTKVTAAVLRVELGLLEKADFIEKKEAVRAIASKKGGASRKKKMTVYSLLNSFPLLEPFRALLLESELVTLPDLPVRFKTAGKIKLFVVSGIFMRDLDRSLDLLIVGDKLDTSGITKHIALLESEIGRELRYATFTTDEFMYRIKMYDKLLRDIFDYPHQKLINQIAISELA